MSGAESTSVIQDFITEHENTVKRMEKSFKEITTLSPFIFGKPTPSIALVLMKLYHENMVRILNTGESPIKTMFGILETSDGQLYCTLSGEPKEIGNFNDRRNTLLSLLHHANIHVVYPEGDDAPPILSWKGAPSVDPATILFTTDGTNYDKMLHDIPISINFVNSNAYMEGRQRGESFAPFKVIESKEGRKMLECGYGSSCVEAKLFSYIYSQGKTFADIKGFAAYWIGDKIPPNHKNKRFCYADEDRTQIDSMVYFFLRQLEPSLRDHLRGTYPASFNRIIRYITELAALPCVGCVANYIFYKQNEKTRWNPTRCGKSITMVGGRRRQRRCRCRTRKH